MTYLIHTGPSQFEDDEDESSDGAAEKTIFDSGTSMHDDFSHLVDLSNPRIRDRHRFLEDDEDESSDGAAGKTIFDSGTSMYEGSSISLIYLT